MLTIRDLQAGIEGRKIFKASAWISKTRWSTPSWGWFSKSTLASVLAGRKDCRTKLGSSVEFLRKDLLDLWYRKNRAGRSPRVSISVEIPGLSTTSFIKTAVNEVHQIPWRSRWMRWSSWSWWRRWPERISTVLLLNRSLSEGFSGGEKKRKRDLPRWPCWNLNWHPGPTVPASISMPSVSYQRGEQTPQKGQRCAADHPLSAPCWMLCSWFRSCII